MPELSIPERYLRLILDAIPDGISVEMDGRIVYANLGFVRLHGYGSPEDLLGRSLGSLIAPEDAERVSLYAEQRRTGESAPLHYQFKALRRDGTAVDVEVFVAAFELEGSFYVLGALRDIGERTLLARRAAHGQRLEALGTLASGVAHDFNNLLMTISGNASLAEQAMLSGGDGQRYLERIQQAASTGSQLTRQLQAFAGNLPRADEAADPLSLLRETMEMVEPMLPATIRVELDHPAALARVAMGAGPLQQILMNLVLNARDAMPHGGLLRLTAGLDSLREGLPAGVAPGRFVRFQIRDTGTGISPAVQPRIFEPFFTTKEADRGTGLGLSVVFGILRSHGGWIEVQSEMGSGTGFSFWVPVAAELFGTDQPAVSCGGQERPRKSRILVVEDDGGLRALLQETLEMRGYEVRVAAGGEEGLLCLRQWVGEQGKVDMACVDLVMPGMDGVACAAEMRRMQPDLCIILCTGVGEDERLGVAPPGLLQGIVRKPVAMGTLLSFIREKLAGEG